LKCSICEYVTCYNSNLLRHLRVHIDERPFTCDHGNCSASYRSLTDLKVHARSHSEDTPYSCDICEVKFKYPNNLINHRRNLHPRQAKWKCDICYKEFGTEDHLKRHLLGDCKKANYSCQMCGKVYTRKLSLRYHIQTHTQEKPYGCPICKKEFRLRGNLINHAEDHRKLGTRTTADVSTKGFGSKDLDGATTGWECKNCEMRCGRKLKFIRHQLLQECFGGRRELIILLHRVDEL